MSIIIIIGVIAIIFLLSYSKVIKASLNTKKIKREFSSQIVLLSDLFNRCIIIRTSKLGLGLSRNTSVSFGEAMEHQEIALATAVNLIKKMEKAK